MDHATRQRPARALVPAPVLLALAALGMARPHGRLWRANKDAEHGKLRAQQSG